MFYKTLNSIVLITLTWVSSTAGQVVIEPIPILNLVYYSGPWYQMYVSLLPNITFEHGMYCVTADYQPSDVDGVYTITEGGNKGSPGGDWCDVDVGVLTQNDTSGALKMVMDIKFRSVDIQLTWAYWVLAVGPVVNDQYQWAVVSDPDQTMLFVLARDPLTFQDIYKDAALAAAQSMGFTEQYNSPLETYQGNQCLYDSAPEGDVDAFVESINMNKLHTLLAKMKSAR